MGQLRTFLAVARTGSITAAAQGCRLSQPSVSRTMAALERHLGVTLLIRQRTGVTLTGAG